jgi:hypothetical protein
MTRLAIAALVLLAPALVAADPNPSPACGANLALGVQQIGVDADSTYYFDHRNFVGSDFWIYEESNGIFDPDGPAIWNVQRGGASELTASGDPCDDLNPAGPDTLIF